MTIHITKKYLSDLPGLVVSSEQSHPVWPPSFEHHQPGEGLEAVVAAVHEVAHEDVVGVGRRPALPEQLLQVVELAVDIAADGDGAADQSEGSMGPVINQSQLTWTRAGCCSPPAAGRTLARKAASAHSPAGTCSPDTQL